MGLDLEPQEETTFGYRFVALFLVPITTLYEEPVQARTGSAFYQELHLRMQMPGASGGGGGGGEQRRPTSTNPPRVMPNALLASFGKECSK